MTIRSEGYVLCLLSCMIPFVYFEIYVTLLLIMRTRIGETAFEFH